MIGKNPWLQHTQQPPSPSSTTSIQGFQGAYTGRNRPWDSTRWKSFRPRPSPGLAPLPATRPGCGVMLSFENHCWEDVLELWVGINMDSNGLKWIKVDWHGLKLIKHLQQKLFRHLIAAWSDPILGDPAMGWLGGSPLEHCSTRQTRVFSGSFKQKEGI